MFLSQYSMLKSLGYGDDSAIKEETDKILAPYKIFVLVLHDPRAHITFHERFSELFEKLDYLTGRNLLFMGIARPSMTGLIKNRKETILVFGKKISFFALFMKLKTRIILLPVIVSLKLWILTMMIYLC